MPLQEHKPELVLRQEQAHAGDQLHLPRGQRGGAGDGRPARMQVRAGAHHSMDDAAFNAALQMEDEEGNLGVALTKDLVRIAGTALGRHITTMGPQGAAGVRDAP